MKWIMCYCVGIYMIQRGSSEKSCTEPQLLLKETYCGYDNLTSLTMYTFNEELKETAPETITHQGCGIDLDENYLNDTFYLDCEAETNCFDGHLEAEKVIRLSYLLECEEVDQFIKDTTAIDAHNATNGSSREIDPTTTETTTNIVILTTDVDETGVTDVESWPTFDVFGIKSTTSYIEVFRNKNTTSSIEVVRNKGSTTLEIDVLETTSETYEFRNETVTALKVNEQSLDSSNVWPVLGYSVAALGATVGVAFGIYKLKSSMQSGSYLFPDTPRPPNFIELA